MDSQLLTILIALGALVLFCCFCLSQAPAAKMGLEGGYFQPMPKLVMSAVIRPKPGQRGLEVKILQQRLGRHKISPAPCRSDHHWPERLQFAATGSAALGKKKKDLAKRINISRPGREHFPLSW